MMRDAIVAADLRASCAAVHPFALGRHNLTSMPRDAISSFAWRTLYSP